MTEAIKILQREHDNIATVLACLDYLVNDIGAGKLRPNFNLLYSILDYIEAFPESFHHPKEEDFIFEALSRRSTKGRALIDRLRDEHAQGIDFLTKLRDTLTAYHKDASAFPSFRDVARAYIDFEYAHMQREEEELLPLAEESLKDEDWTEIDQAFARNDDPLFGLARGRRFQALYEQIQEGTRGGNIRARARF